MQNKRHQVISVCQEMCSSISKETIEWIIKEEGYISHTIREKNFTSQGDNYFGQLFEIDIEGKTPKGDKVTSLFAKKCPAINKLEGFAKITDFFVLETFFYDELSKIYIKLQEEANVPIKNRYNIIRNYKTSMSTLILMDNKAKQGFRTPFRIDVVSLQFAKLSIEQLAKFHGLSFVLENRMPNFFRNKITKIKLAVEFNDMWKKYVTSVVNITIENIEDDLKKRVVEYFPALLYHWKKHFYGNDETLTSCLRHGDYTLPNILMKEVDGEVVEVIPIDYQMLHYGSPVTDFMDLIFSSTDQQFRKNHLSYLKDFYHQTLGRFLKYFDLDVDQIYPREDFELAFKERLNYGIYVAVFRLPILFINDENIRDIEKADAFHEKIRLDSTFKERFKGIMHDLEDWGCF